MLKGEAKKVYQWEYMRRKRGSNKYYNKRAVLLDPMNVRPISNVRPLTREDVRPKPEHTVQPKAKVVQPNEDIIAQVKRLYPDGRLPNCPDGRHRPNVRPQYRPFSKAEQAR